MRTKKILSREFDEFSALRGMTETYEDVAVSKMQEIRAAVLKNRTFLSGVEEIYSFAKASYVSQVLLISNKKKRESELAQIHKNQKTVAVFISGNHSLLGSVVFQSYKVFLNLIHQINCDKVILGEIGRYLATDAKPQIVFSYFPMDDFNLIEAQVKPVLDMIKNYEKIFVIYPRFKTVLVQLPQIDDISGGINLEQVHQNIKTFYFEPSPYEVMSYFDTQIIGTLFRQKILESMLAKYASRLTIMDEATQTISKFIAKNRQEEIAVLRREQNRKLLNSFAGVTLWEK